MSYESTIKYYELILEKYFEKYKDYNYPEIVIFSLNFQTVIDLEHSDDTQKYVEYLMEGIHSLENAAVDFILMAANSVHAVYYELHKHSKVPILSIVEVTAKTAKKENLKKLLLMGIKFTMQSTFYQEQCKEIGINVITPSLKEQNEINRIIFEELVIGIFKNESKGKLLEIIKNYEVDGVILGCTELPLIVKQRDINIRLLNTLEIHVKAALNLAY